MYEIRKSETKIEIKRETEKNKEKSSVWGIYFKLFVFYA